MKKRILLIINLILLVISGNAGTYDYQYSYIKGSVVEDGNEKPRDLFSRGRFDSIERFTPLYFENGDKAYKDEVMELYDSSDKNKSSRILLENILRKVKNKLKRDENIYISIVAHINKQKNLDKNKTIILSRYYSQSIKNKFLQAGIDSSLLYTEARGALDPISTQLTNNNINGNTRVNIAIYTQKKDTTLILNYQVPPTILKISPPKKVKPISVATPVHKKTKIIDLTPKSNSKDFSFIKANFDSGSFVLTDELKQNIKQTANYSKKNTNLFLLIAGYANNLGSAKYNVVLSYKRAKIVKNYLIELGLSSNKLKIIAKGKKNTILKNEAKKEEKLSHHINIEFLKKSDFDNYTILDDPNEAKLDKTYYTMQLFASKSRKNLNNYISKLPSKIKKYYYLTKRDDITILRFGKVKESSLGQLATIVYNNGFTNSFILKINQ
jgi:outer membrane protein OmpA-like peptidoglycan-associated protein